MAAQARDAFAAFEGSELELIQVNDFAALAEAALHQKARKSFRGFVRSGEVDLPEIGSRIENVNGVEEAIRFLVDFGDDPRTRALPFVALTLATQVEFLTHGNFLGEAQDAAIAADEQSFRDLFERGAAAGHPGCLDGHADGHAVTLAEAVGNGSHSVFHEIAEFQTSTQILREPAGEVSFVVPTNSIRWA